MDSRIRDNYNTIAQECGEYEPIAAAQSLRMAFEDDLSEDAGCDSCVHFHNGACNVYQNDAGL